MMKLRRGYLGEILQILGGLTLLVLIIPLALVALLAFSGDRFLVFPPSSWSLASFERLIIVPAWRQALGNSLLIASAVSVGATSMATAAAYGWRSLSRPFQLLLLALLAAPLVVPPLVLAIGFLRLFSALHIYDTHVSIVCAHLVLAMPYAYAVMAIGFRRIDLRLEDIACTLGATRFRAFLQVTLPQLRRSFYAAGFLSFLISFDEPVMALFITGPQTRTLPRQIFDIVRYDADPTVAAVSLFLIILAVIVALLLRA